MAIVSAEAVREGFIKSISDLVGYRLSTMTSITGEQIPSVIKDRIKSFQPEFPYIVVSTPSTSKTGGSWLKTTKTIVVNGIDRPTYVTEETISIEVLCYGENAHDILTELRLNTNDDFTRHQINASTGALIQYSEDIIYRPQYLETDFIEGYSTSWLFTAVSEFTPASGGIIDTVILDGEVKYQPDDPNSIPVSIIEDSLP